MLNLPIDTLGAGTLDTDIGKILLKLGADVNLTRHENLDISTVRQVDVNVEIKINA